MEMETKERPADVLSAVWTELSAALQKFPTWPTDPLHALAVLGEEFGELTKDVLQMTYEPGKTNAENVRKEAIQTAAMALRFVASLDSYIYKAGEQHRQEQWQASLQPAVAPELTDGGIYRLNEREAAALLVRHGMAAGMVDVRYTPSRWMVDAVMEAANVEA